MTSSANPPFGENTWGLMAILYVVLIAMAWGYTQIFTGRAAFLHLGAFTATIMSANVFSIIIPNQKIVVADLIAGRTPDPKYGRIAKQRSLHNNYLTLPVIFFMLSNHYPLAFGTQFKLDYRCPRLPDGRHHPPLVQHTHARKGKPTWTWLVTVLIFIVIMCSPPSRSVDRGEDRLAVADSAALCQRCAFRSGQRISCRAVAACAMRQSPPGKASALRPNR